MLGQMLTLETGNWSGRKWQKVDKRKVDSKVVSEIDDLLVESWQSLPSEQKTLWHIG